MAITVAPAARLWARRSSAAPGGDGQGGTGSGQYRSSFQVGSWRRPVVIEAPAPEATGMPSRPASLR
jgi:hypothetical protein